MEKLIQIFTYTLEEPLFYLFISVIALIFFVVNAVRKSDKKLNLIRKQYSDLEKHIQYAVAPKYIEASPTVKSLIGIAIEVWRISNKVELLKNDVAKDKIISLENSSRKLSQHLNEYDVEIIDHSGEKYNEGMNLEVLSVDKDPSIKEALVKEVVEPTVMIKGQVVSKAKVIIVKP